MVGLHHVGLIHPAGRVHELLLAGSHCGGSFLRRFVSAARPSRLRRPRCAVVGQPGGHCLALASLYGGLGGRLCGIAPGAALAAVRVDREKAVSVCSTMARSRFPSDPTGSIRDPSALM
jgi:hypothetical protein